MVVFFFFFFFLVDEIMFHNHMSATFVVLYNYFQPVQYGARMPLVLGQLECQSEQERTMNKAIFASTEHTTNSLELSAEVALPWNHQWQMMVST